MATYTSARRCQLHQGVDSFPVRSAGSLRWTTRGDLQATRTIKSSTFRPRGIRSAAHDRIFVLCEYAGTYGVRTILARDFDGQWPQVELHASETEAGRAFDMTVARYLDDPRWDVVPARSDGGA